MIAFDVLEQVNSEALALIHADGRQHARSGAIEITRNLIRIEGSHSQVGMISVDDQRLSSAGDAEGRGQAMRLAGQRGQRLRPFGQVAGLVKNPAFERERLIGADAMGVRTRRANRKRLGFGQLDGQIFKRPIAGEIAIFSPRSSTLGTTHSASSPAAESKARRLSLVEARIKGSGAAPQRPGGRPHQCHPLAMNLRRCSR